MFNVKYVSVLQDQESNIKFSTEAVCFVVFDFSPMLFKWKIPKDNPKFSFTLVMNAE